MSITVVTGTPGAGKSLYMVQHIYEKLVKLDRPIYANIVGLKADHPNINIVENDAMHLVGDYPVGSIFVFDECQRFYPTRAVGKAIPPFISVFETHRHSGYDFYLITQAPTLLDRNILKLCDHHVHLYRHFGLKRSRLFEWDSINFHPNPEQTASTGLKSEFVFKKKYFDKYKSAEVHNVKVRLPWKMICLFFGSIAFLIVMSFFIYGRLAKTFHWDGNSGVGGGIASASISHNCVVSFVARSGDFLLVDYNGQRLHLPKDVIDIDNTMVSFDYGGEQCFVNGL